MDQAKFIELLENVLAPDTARVKAATATLRKDYYSSPESLTLLLQLLTSHESPQLRQLAGTQARSLVPKHWPAVPAASKPQIRNHLLQATLHEQTSLVRHSGARVISAIAKIDVEDGEWADLPGLMQTAATSSSAQEREVSTYILFTILESIGDGYMHRFQELFTLFESTIHDPESGEVRINTLLALGKMGMLLDADNDEVSLEAFHKALPSMVAILKQAIDVGDEERTMQAFEIFQSLLECDPKLLTVHFRDLVTFMIELSINRSIHEEARTQALNFLTNCVMFRKLKFQGLRVSGQLTANLLEILAEPKDDSEEEDGDDNDNDHGVFSPTFLSLTLLSMMASHLPPSQIIVPLLEQFKLFSSSPEPRRRRAGISALGSCVEGAPDFVDSQFHEIQPIILQLLNDPDIKVRQAATSGTRLIADHLSETMGKEHQKFMGAFVKNLRLAMEQLNGDRAKSCTNIVVHCCGAIESLVEGLEQKDMAVYLPRLVPNLTHLFSHPENRIKSAAIGAVGSIAECAKIDFLPYFEQTMNALSSYVTIKENDDELALRAMTCDAMGSIALAVGPEPFQSYVRPLMQSSEEGLHLDNSRLKESSYMLWGTLAKVYGTEFKPFLPGVVRGLLKSIQQDENDLEVELGEEAADLVGAEIVIAGKKVKVVNSDEPNGVSDEHDPKFDGMEDAEDEVDDEDDDSDWDDIAGLSILEEKEIATEALADVMSHSKREYLPYVEETIEVILPLASHAYESVRRAALSTLFRAYGTLWELQSDELQNWQPGLPLKNRPSNELMKLGEIVMAATIEVWPEDVDSSVVLEVNRNLAETLKLCGPAIISGNNVVEKIAQTALSIVKKQHPCQKDGEDSDDDLDDQEESSEDEWYVIDTTFEVVTSLAAALGEQFGQLWKLFEKPILQYASSSDPGQRSSAVGTIADVIRGMGSAVTPFTPGLLKALVHRMSDENALTKSNAAFAVGLLVENSESNAIILKAYNTILSKLEPLFHTRISRQVDNAAGAVSRMIMKHPSKIPLGEVLPALLAEDILPLKEDYEENDPIYRMIVQLYSSGEPTITSLTPQLIPIIAQVISPPTEQLTDETREQLTQLVKFVHSQQPALVEAHAVLMATVHG